MSFARCWRNELLGKEGRDWTSGVTESASLITFSSERQSRHHLQTHTRIRTYTNTQSGSTSRNSAFGLFKWAIFQFYRIILMAKQQVTAQSSCKRGDEIRDRHALHHRSRQGRVFWVRFMWHLAINQLSHHPHQPCAENCWENSVSRLSRVTCVHLKDVGPTTRCNCQSRSNFDLKITGCLNVIQVSSSI